MESLGDEMVLADSAVSVMRTTLHGLEPFDSTGSSRSDRLAVALVTALSEVAVMEGLALGCHEQLTLKRSNSRLPAEQQSGLLGRPTVPHCSIVTARSCVRIA